MLMKKYIIMGLLFVSCSANGAVKLSPQVKEVEQLALDKQITTKNLRSSIVQTSIVDDEGYHKAAKVISVDDNKLVTMSRGIIHVDGLDLEHPQQYWGIFRPKQIKLDADKHQGQENAYKLTLIAKAKLKQAGEISVMQVYDARDVVAKDCVVMPIPYFSLPYYLKLRSPLIDAPNVKFLIPPTDNLAYLVKDNISLDVGKKHGSKVGDVYDIFAKPQIVDYKDNANEAKQYAIPGDRKARLLVYLVHDNVSEALVVEQASPIFFDDTVHPSKDFA